MAKAWTEEQKQAAREAYQARISASPKEQQVAEQPKEEEDTPHGMRMDYSHKIQSMSNAIKILPPNMIKDGRHLKENVQAICGFMVSDEMMDEVYKDYTHPEY